MQKEMSFFSDHMLKNVARWLNILGYPCYDTKKDLSDNEILKECKKDQILVTKDKELYQRAQKKGLNAILIRSKKIEDILYEIFSNLDIKKLDFFRKKLCSFCGIELEEIKKEKIEDKIPRGTYKKIENFWTCKKCGNIFWEGAHWNKILQIAENIEKKIKSRQVRTGYIEKKE